MKLLCPHCGGALPGPAGQFTKCRHCGSDFYWGAGRPYRTRLEANNAIKRGRGTTPRRPKPVAEPVMLEPADEPSPDVVDARIRHLLLKQKQIADGTDRLGFFDRCLLKVVSCFHDRRDREGTIDHFLSVRRKIYSGWGQTKQVPAALLWVAFAFFLSLVVFIVAIRTPRAVQPHVVTALNKLSVLSAAAAKELVKFEGEELDLSGLKSIDDAVAAELAKWPGERLKLNGLESLDAGAARELSAWKGKTLDLSGLEQLSQVVAQALARWRGELLRLAGVKSMADDVALELAKAQAASLDLVGLVSVGEETFAILKVNPRIALPATQPSVAGGSEKVPAIRDALPAEEVMESITNSIGIKLNKIPAGTFMMGDANGQRDETPHEVTLTQPFYLGVTEVTNAQWKAVMGNVPSNWKDDELPVEQVSWGDVVSFCKKLSSLPAERAAGRVYRLPTEAEWEYACRAGTSTSYSFGNDESLLGDFAWLYENAGSRAHAVGQKQPNAWGLYDMHGNVWEWCSDWFGDYPGGAVSDPQGVASGSPRVNRGGSWNFSARSCRSAIRRRLNPWYRFNDLGFRLALSPSDSKPPEAGGTSERKPGGSPSERATAAAGAAGNSMETKTEATPEKKPVEPPKPVAAGERINKPLPLPAGLPETFTNSIGVKMQLIPAGTFTMGEGSEAHEVTLTQPFYLGVTEVTNAQGKTLMGFVPSKWKEDDLPVESLSWDEAVKFCEILSSRPAERRAGRVYRLPTEAEWEFACRAGTTIGYSFGNDDSLLGDFAWFSENAGNRTHAVGQKRPNAWGLYDMHGNVFEWCSDRFGDYTGGAVSDPQGVASGSNRVFRGGSWLNSAGHCRSAYRGRDDPSIRYYVLGFRLALSPSGSKPPEAGQ
jgi:formylglycine-generating enzyme required for sulfatase activity